MVQSRVETGLLSERARNLAPSPTVAMDTRAKTLLAQGVDVVNLTAGEPDFPTVPVAAAAAHRAIDAGFTRYTASSGIVELRQEICAKFLRDNALAYSPDDVVVTPGAKYALYAAMQVLCDPGDEVLIPSPYWVSYPEQVKLAGAVPVFVPTREEDGFCVRAEVIGDYVTARTKMLLLNSPCNPTGSVVPRAELEAIGELVLAHGRMVVLSDEIYESLVYGAARHDSLAALDPALKAKTVTINGLSKAYAMTGWRVGYAAADRAIAQAMGNLLSQTTSGINSIAQKAAVAALRDGQADVQVMAEEFARRREYVLARLAGMPGVRCVPPDGAFYVFPNVSSAFGRTTPAGVRLTDIGTLGLQLLDEAGVATVPGDGFGVTDHIRISYAASLSTLERGCDRLEEFFRGLR